MSRTVDTEVDPDPMPFEPESLGESQRRYPAAIADLCAVVDANSYQPGRHRKHVFDSAGGMRLIVSRDLTKGRELLHLSASAYEGSDLWNSIRSGRVGPGFFLGMAEARFRAVSGDVAEFDSLVFSPGKGIPHWFRQLKGVAR